MKTVRLGDKGMAMLMKSAKKVPRGTAFVMSGGQLYMVNASKMFDRAGNAMFGGQQRCVSIAPIPARATRATSHATPCRRTGVDPVIRTAGS